MIHDLLADDMRLERPSFAATSPLVPNPAAPQGARERSTLSW